jgi:hypothetical protein
MTLHATPARGNANGDEENQRLRRQKQAIQSATTIDRARRLH